MWERGLLTELNRLHNAVVQIVMITIPRSTCKDAEKSNEKGQYDDPKRSSLAFPYDELYPRI